MMFKIWEAFGSPLSRTPNMRRIKEQHPEIYDQIMDIESAIMEVKLLSMGGEKREAENILKVLFPAFRKKEPNSKVRL